MRRTDSAFFGLHQLRAVWLGAVRVRSAGQRVSGKASRQDSSRRRERPGTIAAPQIDLLPSLPAHPPTRPSAGSGQPLPVLDERSSRGAKFIGLPVSSV
ncbi:MAG TPA: hypothetical protein VFH26_04150, partial [Gemmatimonadales bacterium]|nr:hypothetical protein [Gemmatimonadales bacterium]